MICKRCGAAMSDDPDRYIDTHEAAALIGLDSRTLDKWRVTGDGPPFVRISRRAIRYRRATVLEWMAKREHPHTASYDRKR